MRSIKSIFVHIRNSFKLIILLTVAIAIIVGLLSLVYKPVYSVSINGEFVGYTSNRSDLQRRINDYMMQGNRENIGFVDIYVIPEYDLRLVRRNTEVNDEAILAMVKDSGTTYYRYYAIILNNEVQSHVSDRETAEAVIEELRRRGSANISNIAYTQVTSPEMKEFSESETIVASLFVAPRPVTTAVGGAGNVSRPATSNSVPNIGMSFIRPTSGTVTSRFGPRRGGFHTGLDIAAPMGTPIFAAASGTVTRSGPSGGGYGTLVLIDHGNGVQTLYAHASRVYVSPGQTVAQGQRIAAVGSTGNSTGPHLHFEIRVNGTAVNPQNFI